MLTWSGKTGARACVGPAPGTSTAPGTARGGHGAGSG